MDYTYTNVSNDCFHGESMVITKVSIKLNASFLMGIQKSEYLKNIVWLLLNHSIKGISGKLSLCYIFFYALYFYPRRLIFLSH